MAIAARLWHDHGSPPPGAALRDPAAPEDDPRPQPPEPPLPSDCCDSGCDPCIYDLYNDELQLYRQRLADWLQRHPHAR